MQGNLNGAKYSLNLDYLPRFICLTLLKKFDDDE